MKSIYFLLYFTRKGARHGVYAGAFARKTASLKNPKGLSSGVPKAPTKDKRLVSIPHEGAQSHRCT
jgi:hypothetical protein